MITPALQQNKHSSVALIENNLQRAEIALSMDSPKGHYWSKFELSLTLIVVLAFITYT